MANSVVNRQVNIFIESGQAQKALDALIKKETALKVALDKATDPKKIEQLKTELDRLQEPIDRARKKLSGELAPSFRDVQKTVNDLGNRLKRMSEEDADYSSVIKQYRQASAELDQQKQKVGILGKAMRSFWQEAKTVAVGVLVGNTVQSALETVLSYVSGMVTGSAKIADELSDIEKTTGLTTKQVREVNKELAKIDTRTSAAQLRELASEAGKLGKDSVESVVAFVDAADKINVALKEDLGPEAILDIAKTSEIFKTEMLNIASAINEIGANSAASEAFSVDFLKRLAGTAPTVKLAADEVLGYSAALEIAGQTTEVSATALNTFFLDFVSNIEKFGKAAGFAEGEMTKLIGEKGTNEAFLQFLERLKQANPDAASFINKLRELGIDGARGSNVMLALANNIETVRKQQQIANTAIQSNASIMDEFAKKNSNANAELDKMKKNFASLFTSDSIRSFGEGAIRTLNSLIDLLKASIGFIKEHGVLVGILGGIYAIAGIRIKGYVGAQIFSNTVTAISSTIQKAAAAAATIYRIVLITLTRQVTLATGAQLIWNTVVSLGAGPMGILLVAIGAVSVAISAMVHKFNEANAAQKLNAEIARKVAESTSDTVEKMRELTEVAKDNNVSLDNRKKALNALIAIAPDYLRGLTLENINTDEGRKILEGYNKELRTKAQLEAKGALLKEKLKQKEDLQLKLGDFKAGDFITGDATSQLLEAIGIGDGKKAKQTLRDLVQIDEQIKILQKDIDTAGKKNIEDILGGGDNGNNSNPPPAVGKLAQLRKALQDLQDDREKATDDKTIATLNKKIKDTEDAIDKLLGKSGAAKRENNTANDIKQLREELDKLATSLLPENTDTQKLAKELQALEDRYAKYRERAHGNNELLKQIETLYQLEKKGIADRFFAEQQRNLDEAVKLDKARNEQRLKNEQEYLDKLRPLLDKAIEQHNQMLKTIDRDNIARDQLNVIRANGLKRLNANKELLNEQMSQELANTSLTENEKELIREQYRQKEKDAEAEFWMEVVGFAQQGLQLFEQYARLKANKENAELARDKAINDKKRENLDKRLKAGLISQEQYDRQIGALQKKQEAKEKEIRQKQFKREQAASIAAVLINAAEAGIKLWAKPGWPAALPLLGLLALQTGLQIGVIASQKPPQYGRGGFLFGKSHAEGGMGVYDQFGRKQAELEGGEGIGSKKTMSDRRRYSVEGTPSQIFSLLNGMNGGVQWASGATLRPAWSLQKAMPMNFAAINSSLNTVRRFYAAGGKFDENNNPVTSGGSSVSQEMLQVIMHLVATVDGLNATLADIRANGIKAGVALTDIEDQQKRKANLLKEAGNG